MITLCRKRRGRLWGLTNTSGYGADEAAVGAMKRPLRRCWSILETFIIGIRHDFNHKEDEAPVVAALAFSVVGAETELVALRQFTVGVIKL